MKYFVEVRGTEGAFHIEIEDARDIYILMEECGAIPKGEARQAYDEGRLVETTKSNARKIWGEEMDDRKLMIETMKGKIHKKTAMSVKLPKPKQDVDEYIKEREAEDRFNEVYAAAEARAKKSEGVMTREEYDAEIPEDAMQDLIDMLDGDEDMIEDTLQEQYEAYLEEVQ